MSDGRNLEAHLFICTNVKANGECCGAKGSVELRESLKKLCQDKDRGWHGRIRVNASGCLGRCEEGITAVIYPQAEWHTGLKRESVSELVDALSDILDQ